MARGRFATSKEYGRKVRLVAETANHERRRAVEIAAGRYIREIRDGVTFAEMVSIVEGAGFAVSAGSYEDFRTIQVFSVEIDNTGRGEPKFAASYNKAAKFLSVG